MKSISPQQVQAHYRACFQSYICWSGKKLGGYHFGFTEHWQDIFDHSQMIDNVNSRIFNHLNISKNIPVKILDAGCGSGETICSFKKKFPRSLHQIWGITISNEQHRFGKMTLAQHNIPSNYILAGDFHAIPFEDRFFDAIIFNNSICYSNGASKSDAIQEATRVLKPKGRLAFYDVLLDKPEAQFPCWWRLANHILLDAWKVPAWSELESIKTTLNKEGFRPVVSKDMRWMMSPSLFFMVFIHLPLFFWKAILHQASWHEVGVLLRLAITIPVISIHPNFHHPLCVWEKSPK